LALLLHELDRQVVNSLLHLTETSF
jgi:hypothetical protein